MTVKIGELKFHTDDFQKFRDWLGLRINDITWQGQFTQEFEDFWEIVFIDNITFEELVERFDFLIDSAKIGPLVSWFLWLRNKFVCYIFVTKEYSIYELSKLCGLQIGRLSTLLREFLLERYPYLEEHLSDSFQVHSEISENALLKFSQLKSQLHLEDIKFGGHEDEIMPSLEITLYEDWKDLLKKIKREFKKANRAGDLKAPNQIKINYIRHVRNFSVMMLIFVVSFFALRYVNIKYRKSILDRISIYEPKLNWLDKDLSYRAPVAFESSEGINIDLARIDEEESEKLVLETIDRDGTESDVLVSSWSELPSKFKKADGEVSSYEEASKVGVRDYRFGRNIVHRILLRSEDLLRSKGELNKILPDFETSQVDNVRPGQDVPGGLYYNLFVPEEKVNDFISEIMAKEKGVVYESRTRLKVPKGKGRVLIWIKSI